MRSCNEGGYRKRHFSFDRVSNQRRMDLEIMAFHKTSRRIKIQSIRVARYVEDTDLKVRKKTLLPLHES